MKENLKQRREILDLMSQLNIQDLQHKLSKAQLLNKILDVLMEENVSSKTIFKVSELFVDKQQDVIQTIKNR